MLNGDVPAESATAHGRQRRRVQAGGVHVACTRYTLRRTHRLWDAVYRLVPRRLATSTGHDGCFRLAEMRWALLRTLTCTSSAAQWRRSVLYTRRG